MKIVVTSSGYDLDSPASPVFGRCPVYIFVDTETLEFEAVDNPAVGASGGAGIQAAQFVIEHGAQAVLTGNVGPNAYSGFQTAGVPVYLSTGGSVRQAVEMYQQGQLQPVGGANVQAHAGMGMRGGMGRGMGRGRWATPPQPAPSTATSRASSSGGGEIAALRQMASDLRRQLADIMERIEKLEKKD